MARAGELGFGTPLAANAYLGAWGIVDCLNSGADVVVTGRVTDASVIVGPAAAHFGWGRDDYDALAGAVAAGHVIECGVQATGGNYAFFTEIADLTHPGLPAGRDQRRRVVGDHQARRAPAALVSVDTVTAQLLYEITGARYANPDVTLRMDSIELSPDGADRVRIDGVRGEPPPPTLKVSLNSIGGFRNAMTFVLTGPRHRRQGRPGAATAGIRPDRQAGRAGVDAGPHRPRRRRHRGGRERAAALRRARSRPRQRRSPVLLRRSRIGACQLSGLHHAPHRRATVRCTACSPPGYVDAHRGAARRRARRRHPHRHPRRRPRPRRSSPVAPFALPEPLPFGETRRVPLGRIAGARSGDKGGNANVGVWVRTDDQWRWLAHALTVEKLRELLPETADLPVTRHLLPNLRAVNFVIDGILGRASRIRRASIHRPRGSASGCAAGHIDIPRVSAGHPGKCPMSIWHTPEREQLRKTVRAFAEREVLPHVDEWEHTGMLPRELHRKAGEPGCSAPACPRPSAVAAATAPTR